MRMLLGLIPSWIIVAYRAIRDHYAPLRGSELVKEYPPIRHIEIERFPHLRIDIDQLVPPERRGRWVFEIEAIGVDVCEKITELQNQTRTHFKTLKAMEEKPNADIILIRRQINVLKTTFHIKMIKILYQLSKWRYPSYWEKRDYWKWFSSNCIRDYTLVAKIFQEMIKFNSNVGDFFFPSAREGHLRDVQRPHPRDFWRSVRCNHWRGEWGDLLSAKVLMVFSVIIEGFEKQEEQNRPPAKTNMVEM